MKEETMDEFFQNSFKRESERALSRENRIKNSLEVKGMRHLQGRKRVGKIEV